MLSEYLSMRLMSLTKRVRRTLIICVCTVACLPVANADNVDGAWSSLEDWPLIAIHAAITPDGRVLTYGTDGAGKQTGYFIYDIWDPTAGLGGGHLTLNNMTLTDVFCSSQIILPQTGEILIAGGDNWTGTKTTNTGNNNSNIFTYNDNTLARSVNMNRARWYSSSTALINGDIYVQGGTSGGDLPEVRQADGLFRLLTGAPTDSFATIFPRNFLSPDGRVFGYDTNGKMYFVDASGLGSLITAGQFSSSNAGWTSGAAMFQPGKILQMGGNSNGAIVIDINGPTPIVTPTQSMSSRRHWVSATVLADGQVLGTGGSKVENKLDGVNTNAEIWNPATGSWHLGPPGALARLYHSSALLLPDASVLVAGGGAPGPLKNTNAEIYYPPYLYNGLGDFAVRPQILNTLDTVNVGDTLSIQVDTPNISRVTLVKSGSVTHSVNMDQRFLELSFTESANMLYADLPLQATDTPPGYYLMFVFDNTGVPSVAKMLRINIDPNPNTAVDYTPAIGGGGGSEFRLACDADEILVGVHGNYATYINQIGPKCVMMDQYGRWIGDPSDRPVTGTTTGGTEFSRACPRDFAMSGFQGRSDQYVNQVEIACRALNSDGTLTGEAQYMGGTGGSGGNAQEPLSCATNNPVYALYGQSGGWLDSIGAECRQGLITPISFNSDPVIVNPGAQFGAIGQAVSLDISASDGDSDSLTFSATGLPAGLSINSATGQITGTPTIDTLFITQVTVSDGAQTDTASFDWTISPTLPLSVDPMPPQAQQEVNTEVTYSAGTSGGFNTVYKWNFGDGTPESAFSATSSIVHSYTDPGIYHVTLTVDDDVEEPNIQTFVQTIHFPLTVNVPASSSNIVYEDRSIGNSRLWVVNQDNKTVSVFDAVANTRLKEIPVGDSPRSVAIAPDGRVWVSNKGSATISIIDPATLAVVQTVSLPFASQPYGIVFSPSANEAYVVLEATDRLLKIDGLSGAQLDFFDTAPHPRHVAINAAGTFVYVSRFISARQPGEETDTVHSETNGQKTGGEIQVVDTASMTLISNVILQHSDDDDAENQGSGVPNYIGALAISPDGTSARVPSKKDNISRGTLRSLANLNFQNTVRAISSRIELSTNTEDYASRIDYDDASIASAVIFDHTGVYAFVALETSREVAVVDAYSSSELFRIDVGRAPQGLAISAAGDRLFVSNFMDRSVDVFDLTDLQSNGQWNLPNLATLQSVANEELTAQVLLGKQLFYDARDTRLARDRYLSCAACHNDGAEDGRVWDLTGMGEGLRNTISLRGRSGGQGLLHWSKNFDEVQDFEGQIRSLSGGTGLMADLDFNAGTRSEPLGDAKAGISEDLDALAAYVESLDTHATSPYRNSDGSLTADALAGRQVFQDQNCVTCHGGTDYTDSGFNILMHNIGTLKPSSGQRLGGLLAGFDTPTLRGVWSSAPYLHDGSAQTLDEAVAAHNGVSLNPSDMSLLVAYLKQIDGLEPVANESPIAIASNQVTDEDVAIAITLAGTDPEGAQVSFTVTRAPGNGALSGIAPILTYTPNVDFNGTDSFDFDVLDGNGGSDTATVSITVSSVNDSPVAIADSFSLPVNSLLNIAAPGVLENDTDDNGAALSALIVTGAQYGSVTLNSNGSFTYTPLPGYSGADSFSYAVSDGEFTSNTVVVNITVIADTDGDGVPDNLDAFPNNPTERADSDTDGVGDNADAFPNDPNETVDSDGDGIGDNADPFPNDPNQPLSPNVGKLRHGVITNVGSSWQTVTLPEAYDDMVVVASMAYEVSDLPAVARVRNASGNSFEVRVQNPSGASLSGYTLTYIVAEAGQYTQAADGISYEAVKVTSTITDSDSSWNGQAQSYLNTYTNPVVIGQVMSDNDARWSAFWASDGNRVNPPSATSISVGKNVAEDSDISRFDETLGYFVFETGSHNAGIVSIEAGITADTVKGIVDSTAPWSYPVFSTEGTPVVTLTAMDGANGGWAVLYGDSALNGGTLSVAIDEDQVKDSERNHTTEQVAYVILLDTLDSDGDGVSDNNDAFPFDPTETVDSDGDGIGDNADIFPIDPTETTDSDADGVGDNADAFPNDPNESADTDGDGVGDNTDDLPNNPNETVDTDGDGVGDGSDSFPNNPNEWVDTDGDSTGDNADIFPNDPTETADTDGDGVGDNADAFPNDANEWVDTDGDGVGNNADAFPDDPTRSIDSDGDGVDDTIDAFLNDPTEWVDTDGDGMGDNADAFPNDPTRSLDSDGDGVDNTIDAFPNDPNESVDSDGDGVGDNGDAFPNDSSESADSDGDGVGDNADAFPNNLSETVDSDGDGIGDNSDPFPNDPNLPLPPTVGKLRHGVITDVGSSWQTVTLPEIYDDMVVVASLAYEASDLPAVTRIRNANGNGFDVRVQNPSGASLSGYTLTYIVAEAGQYTQAADGINYEAVKVTSTITDSDSSWNGQAQSYLNTYTNPVVIGQVMSHNDARWSAFWASDGNRVNPPSATSISVGKNVAEDSDISRFDETLGYFVFETGSHSAGIVDIEAGITSDIVEGITASAAPWSYPVFSTEGTPVITLAAMDGGNGGWAVLYGDSALNGGTLSVAIDEDQVNDSERAHTTEQVAYVILLDTLDSDGDGVSDSNDAFPNDPNESADSDGDGVGDNGDAFPNDPTETVDTDSDGVGDNSDAFLNDPNESADGDGDGVGDNADAFPNDASETTDTDDDGVGDNSDTFPNDPTRSIDSDGDGADDSVDAFPNDPTESVDTDGDGVGDNDDLYPNDPNESADTDGDGVGDNADTFPNDPTEWIDSDGDGIGDNTDPYPNDPNNGVNPATDILVANHSFEADNVANGAYIVGAASWTFTAVGGVFDRGGPGAYDFQNWTGTTPDASDAEQMAWIDIGSIYQTTGTNLVAGATYTLTVDIGDRSDRAFRGDAILLGTSSTFGTNYLTPTVVSNTTPTSTYGNASNGWETWESTFTVGSGNVGEALRIEITGTGNAFNVDNVRLVNTTVPFVPPIDTDGDGVYDGDDAFPNDPNEWADSDGDGVGDNADAFPNDASETTDTDDDGVGDNSDPYPDDSTNTSPTLDFNVISTSSYSTQDAAGNVSVADNGTTLVLTDNTWRQTGQTFNINVTTMLEFDFQSTVQGEVQGIGFDEDNDALNNARIFRLYGTQIWGIADFATYSGGLVHYQIPVGQYYTGAAMRLVFANDNDAGAGNDSRFSNVRVYESN